MERLRRRSGQTVTGEKLKDLLGLPLDAILTGMEWKPATKELRVYYATETAPLIPEGCSAFFTRRRFSRGDH